VLDALRAGEIRRERYDAYQGMAAPTADLAEERQRPAADYRHTACTESFVCKVCGTLVVPEGAGRQHRNHCPKCLSSVHVDNRPGDRASLCNGVMEPVSVWVRKGGEWAIIHRCRLCGTLSSNRIAGDDNPMLLMSIAVKPLAAPPFPLGQLAPPQ
jgi:ribosome biogenesis GTPase